MVKKILSCITLLGCAAMAFGQAGGLKTESVDELGAQVWKISPERKPDYSDRTVNPTYVIYPDRPATDPMAVVKSFGMEKHLDEFLGTVYVVNPAGGKKYSASKDLDVFYALLKKLRAVNNLKLIGKGAGATFINNTLAPHAQMVAGILTIGGSLSDKADFPVVPAYVASSSKAVADRYIRANHGEAVGDGVWENPAHPLERVVVDSRKRSDSEIFADAWDRLFSRNYRYSNYKTWYTGVDYRTADPFELVSYVMFDRLGIQRNILVQNLCGWGDFLWYEFIPERLLKAPKGTVPLVVMLHGFGNDPRTQAETSGFVELAAEKGFITVEFEWQGRDKYASMGLDGIEATIRHLLEKYPQLDPSRVYCEGLSAGALNTTLMCLFKTNLIAAGGAMAGGVIYDTAVNIYGAAGIDRQIERYKGQMEVGYLLCAGTNDSRFTYAIPEEGANPSSPQGSLLRGIRDLSRLNGIELGATADPSIDPMFGMKVANRKAIQTQDNLIMHEGSLLKGDKELIKMIALEEYGHWNYKGVAREMWEFFTHFARDPKTKELIYKP